MKNGGVFRFPHYPIVAILNSASCSVSLLHGVGLRLSVTLEQVTA